MPQISSPCGNSPRNGRAGGLGNVERGGIEEGGKEILQSGVLASRACLEVTTRHVARCGPV